MERVALMLLLCLSTAAVVVRGEDPYLFFDWDVTYGTISPLGIPQKAILINNQFPGPNINSTTNNNIVINIFNHLDEPILFTWAGIQHRKNSYLDGTLGTNCPIPPGTNQTYHFQVKDQIGSYMYYPITGMHKAVGGFGGLRVNSRLLIPVPYADPADDYTVLIGDWYTKSHTALKNLLDSGKSIGRPGGILINGRGAAKGDGKEEPWFTMEPGKTYKYRICNVGLKTSLNFRIQGHSMKLVELEGSHTVQNSYDSLDVHLGQCMAVLVTADQEAKDYYMVASTRFLKKEIQTTGIIRYKNGNGAPAAALPPAPAGWAWSLNQFRSFRWNLTASAARPNPQGSYHYGSINITRTIILANTRATANGKLRFAINGVSHTDPQTPLKLAEIYSITDEIFKYDVIGDTPPQDAAEATVEPIVIKPKYRDFVEIIFENHEKEVQSYQLNGYSFFLVGMGTGNFTAERRSTYNLLDAVSRHTVQIYPKSWSAILLTFDNAGMWNLRSENWERHYLGQQLYASVLSPEKSLKDENNMPENVLVCGAVQSLPKPPPSQV